MQLDSRRPADCTRVKTPYFSHSQIFFLRFQLFNALRKHLLLFFITFYPSSSPILPIYVVPLPTFFHTHSGQTIRFLQKPPILSIYKPHHISLQPLATQYRSSFRQRYSSVNQKVNNPMKSIKQTIRVQSSPIVT